MWTLGELSGGRSLSCRSNRYGNSGKMVRARTTTSYHGIHLTTTLALRPLKRNESIMDMAIAIWDYRSTGTTMTNGDVDISIQKGDQMKVLEVCPNSWLRVQHLNREEVNLYIQAKMNVCRLVWFQLLMYIDLV